MDKIILASQSPRRKQLLSDAGYDFDVIIADVDETNPPGMPGEQVPEFLARKKADAIAGRGVGGTILAADTIVLLEGDILGKPRDEEDARHILRRLSGKKHLVITGVCIYKYGQYDCFSVTTEVHFRQLSDSQIDYYLRHYQPYDKAGAYAIQEWIGLVGIEKINGDYYNVMGLPVGEVVKRL